MNGRELLAAVASLSDDEATALFLLVKARGHSGFDPRYPVVIIAKQPIVDILTEAGCPIPVELYDPSTSPELIWMGPQ